LQIKTYVQQTWHTYVSLMSQPKFCFSKVSDYRNTDETLSGSIFRDITCIWYIRIYALRRLNVRIYARERRIKQLRYKLHKMTSPDRDFIFIKNYLKWADIGSQYHARQADWSRW